MFIKAKTDSLGNPPGVTESSISIRTKFSKLTRNFLILSGIMLDWTHFINYQCFTLKGPEKSNYMIKFLKAIATFGLS